MDYHVLIEPAFTGSFWCRQYLEGIKYNVLNNNGRVKTINASDIEALAANRKNRLIVLVVGTSMNWMDITVNTLNRYGIHSIILAPSHTAYLPNASSITMDYYKIMHNMCQYLMQLNHSRIALVGIHPNSLNDLSKMNSFMLFMQEHQGSKATAQDVFWNYGVLEKCCDAFYNKIDSYDSAICSNDIVALKLLSYLKKVNVPVPERLFITSIGNSTLCKVASPTITAITLDCFAIGKSAVHMYTFLMRNPSLSSLSATVVGDIYVRNSTANLMADNTYTKLPEHKLPHKEDFYYDNDVKTFLHLENLISNCDDLDFAILKGLVYGQKYILLADELHTTENTIKYRLKRMMTLCGQNNRDSLIKLVGHLFEDQ